MHRFKALVSRLGVLPAGSAGLKGARELTAEILQALSPSVWSLSSQTISFVVSRQHCTWLNKVLKP